MGKRNKPFYELLGLKKVGPGKYKDANGKPVSERQYRKMKGKPGKGSPGYKKRMSEKKQGRDVLIPPKDLHKEAMQQFAKRHPGATSKWFRTGQEPDVAASDRFSQQKHNQAVQKQRREAVKFHREAGLITEKKAQKLRDVITEEGRLRRRLQLIKEKLDRNRPQPRIKGGRSYTNDERRKLEGQYNKLRKEYRKKGDYLRKYHIAMAEGHPLSEGHYH